MSLRRLPVPELPEHRREKVSYNWLREQLELAFQRLMAIIPKGEEEALIADYCFLDQWHSLREERSPLKLLEDFASAVHQLATIRRSSCEEIKIILEKEVAQMVFMEEDSWTQKYLD